jgi:uncharacterized protein DUF6159
MLQRIGRGWSMAKASWAVLKLHPKLLLLPILSGMAFLALFGVIALSVFAGSKSEAMRHLPDNIQLDQPLIYALLFAFYFACTFIIVYFNAALIFCALQCFAGEEPSLRAGLAAAAGRLPQILGWALVAATVGLLLNLLQSLLKDKLGFLGSLLGGLAETAWAVVTYFVVPVLVVDGVGPIEAVRQSSAILRRTWGEAIGGEGGLGAISLLLFLPVVLLIGLMGTARIDIAEDPVLAVAVIALVVLYILALTLLFTTLGAIFRTATYIYATTGKAPSSMDPALVQGTFRRKE